MTNSLTIPALSDYHVHLRQGDVAARYARHTAEFCGRALVMPNLTPPVSDAATLSAYRDHLTPHLPGVDLLMTFKLLPSTTPDAIDALAAAGAVAGKLYPAGVTTHSSDGVPADVLRHPDEHTAFGDVLERMQHHGLVLCLHGEAPWQEDPLMAEPDFLPFVEWVLDRFVRLRVVVEHITTSDAVECIEYGPDRLAATITLHHLMVSLSHLTGRAFGEPELNCADGKLHPHLFCAPLPKQPEHRLNLRRIAEECPRVFLGSDSAPHPRHFKESASCCAGVFTAPVLAAGLAQLFDSLDALDALADFTSRRGDRFYKRKPTGRTLRLTREAWTVPDEVDGVVPFLAGCVVKWKANQA